MTSSEVPGSRVVREQEIGLRLPNGIQVFPPDIWHGHALATAADREVIVGLIRAAALRLGYDEDHFLDNYAWATREKISAIVYEAGEELPILATGYITEIITDDNIPPFSSFDSEMFEPDIETMVRNSSAAD